MTWLWRGHSPPQPTLDRVKATLQREPNAVPCHFPTQNPSKPTPPPCWNVAFTRSLFLTLPSPTTITPQRDVNPPLHPWTAPTPRYSMAVARSLAFTPLT
ncbi:hypothetical protein PIB30_100544, partial [Stylosanthes scabra]|nr:hypothetical protein [Stylosanthes scabra]